MPIILYVKTGCLWCKGVLELFKEKGVIFEERNVSRNKIYCAELATKTGQTKAPTMDLDGEVTADSDREQIAAILKIKGYPGF